ncbi:MAG: hypothetical protein HYZ53_06355 [Planctomycetes bacterium]|nr:hypothetical protein [Planctomycetota bacterium]
MKSGGKRKAKTESRSIPATHSAYAAALSPEERTLLVLRDALYEHSWEPMLKDLQDRLDGRPYTLKLVARIREDLERIRRLEAYERKHGVDLGTLLPGEE